MIKLWILFAQLIGYLGKDRKTGFWRAFIISIFLSPMIGIIVVALWR